MGCGGGLGVCGSGGGERRRRIGGDGRRGVV